MEFFWKGCGKPRRRGAAELRLLTAEAVLRPRAAPPLRGRTWWINSWNRELMELLPQRGGNKP